MTAEGFDPNIEESTPRDTTADTPTQGADLTSPEQVAPETEIATIPSKVTEVSSDATGIPTLTDKLVSEQRGRAEQLISEGKYEEALKLWMKFIGDCDPNLEYENPQQQQYYKKSQDLLIEGISWIIGKEDSQLLENALQTGDINESDKEVIVRLSQSEEMLSRVLGIIKSDDESVSRIGVEVLSFLSKNGSLGDKEISEIEKLISLTGTYDQRDICNILLGITDNPKVSADLAKMATSGELDTAATLAVLPDIIKHSEENDENKLIEFAVSFLSSMELEDYSTYSWSIEDVLKALDPARASTVCASIYEKAINSESLDSDVVYRLRGVVIDTLQRERPDVLLEAYMNGKGDGLMNYFGQLDKTSKILGLASEGDGGLSEKVYIKTINDLIERVINYQNTDSYSFPRWEEELEVIILKLAESGNISDSQKENIRATLKEKIQSVGSKSDKLVGCYEVNIDPELKKIAEELSDIGDVEDVRELYPKYNAIKRAKEQGGPLLEKLNSMKSVFEKSHSFDKDSEQADKIASAINILDLLIKTDSLDGPIGEYLKDKSFINSEAFRLLGKKNVSDFIAFLISSGYAPGILSDNSNDIITVETTAEGGNWYRSQGFLSEISKSDKEKSLDKMNVFTLLLSDPDKFVKAAEELISKGIDVELGGNNLTLKQVLESLSGDLSVSNIVKSFQLSGNEVANLSYRLGNLNIDKSEIEEIIKNAVMDIKERVGDDNQKLAQELLNISYTDFSVYLEMSGTDPLELVKSIDDERLLGRILISLDGIKEQATLDALLRSGVDSLMQISGGITTEFVNRLMRIGYKNMGYIVKVSGIDPIDLVKCDIYGQDIGTIIKGLGGEIDQVKVDEVKKTAIIELKRRLGGVNQSYVREVLSMGFDDLSSTIETANISIADLMMYSNLPPLDILNLTLEQKDKYDKETLESIALQMFEKGKAGRGSIDFCARYYRALQASGQTEIADKIAERINSNPPVMSTWDEVSGIFSLIASDPKTFRPLAENFATEFKAGYLGQSERGAVETMSNIWNSFKQILLDLDISDLDDRIFARSVPRGGNSDIEMLRQDALDVEYLNPEKLEVMHQMVHNWPGPNNLIVIRAYLRFLNGIEGPEAYNEAIKTVGNQEWAQLTVEDRESLMPTLAETQKLENHLTDFYEGGVDRVRDEITAWQDMVDIPETEELLEEVLGLYDNDDPESRKSAISKLAIARQQIQSRYSEMSSEEKAQTYLLDLTLSSLGYKVITKQIESNNDSENMDVEENISFMSEAIELMLLDGLGNSTIRNQLSLLKQNQAEYSAGKMDKISFYSQAFKQLDIITDETVKVIKSLTEKYGPQVEKVIRNQQARLPEDLKIDEARLKSKNEQTMSAFYRGTSLNLINELANTLMLKIKDSGFYQEPRTSMADLRRMGLF